MVELLTVKCGLFAIHDTKAPAGKDVYTTLILLHGYAWSSPIFSRMLPFAAKYNARVVLVNRCDYPGSRPLGEEDHKLLTLSSKSTPDAPATLHTYLKDRAKDLYDFLGGFITTEKIPQVQKETGGIVLAAWSFGTIYTTSHLAHASSFPVNDVNVASYLRCVENYDTPYHALGYPALEGGYNPLVDQSISREEGVKRFPTWISGYFQHGESPSELEPRNPFLSPLLLSPL